VLYQNFVGIATLLATVPFLRHQDPKACRSMIIRLDASQTNMGIAVHGAALDEVESVVTSDSIMIKAGSTEDLSVAAPQMLSAGESLAATIASHTGRRSVTITVRDEHRRVVTKGREGNAD
jgi:hypothetical protein